MNFLNRLKRPKRLPNITVYYLSAIVDGAAKSSPLGIIPRFSDNYENGIREKHRPAASSSYINEKINGVSVILSWADDKIDAIALLSAEDTRAFPDFSKIPDEELVKFNSVFIHFPR